MQDLEGARQAIVMLLNLVEELKSDNARFLKEKFYSATQRQMYLAALPAGYKGEFGPRVRSLVITLYYGSGITKPKIIEVLVGTPLYTANFTRLRKDRLTIIEILQNVSDSQFLFNGKTGASIGQHFGRSIGGTIQLDLTRFC